MNLLSYQTWGELPARKARRRNSGRGARGTRPQQRAVALLHPFRPPFWSPPPPPARPLLHTSPREPVRFRPHGAHAYLHECFDSSGRGEGAGVARVGSAPPSEGCHYGEPGKRGRAGAPPGPQLTRKQVSRRVGLAGYCVSTVPAEIRLHMRVLSNAFGAAQDWLPDNRVYLGIVEKLGT